MMDVGKVFVIVTDGEVAVLRPGEHLDQLGSMMRIARVDRVGVLDGVVAVEMSVMARRDEEHTDE